jgi:hypothetical protein
MKTATITIPDDLDAELDEVARERNITPAEVIEVALRKYLTETHRRSTETGDDEYRPFWLPVIPEKDDRGEPDVSVNHDKYLAEFLERKLKRS